MATTTLNAERGRNRRIRVLSKALRRQKEEKRRAIREVLRQERVKVREQGLILRQLHTLDRDQLIDRAEQLQAQVIDLQSWAGFLKYKLGR